MKSVMCLRWWGKNENMHLMQPSDDTYKTLFVIATTKWFAFYVASKLEWQCREEICALVIWKLCDKLYGIYFVQYQILFKKKTWINYKVFIYLWPCNRKLSIESCECCLEHIILSIYAPVSNMSTHSDRAMYCLYCILYITFPSKSVSCELVVVVVVVCCDLVPCSSCGSHR